MTNEEKTHNICSETNCIGLSCEQCRYVTAIKMAEWKDAQYEEMMNNYRRRIEELEHSISLITFVPENKK